MVPHWHLRPGEGDKPYANHIPSTTRYYVILAPKFYFLSYAWGQANADKFATAFDPTTKRSWEYVPLFSWRHDKTTGKRIMATSKDKTADNDRPAKRLCLHPDLRTPLPGANSTNDQDAPIMEAHRRYGGEYGRFPFLKLSPELRSCVYTEYVRGFHCHIKPRVVSIADPNTDTATGKLSSFGVTNKMVWSELVDHALRLCVFDYDLFNSMPIGRTLRVRFGGYLRSALHFLPRIRHLSIIWTGLPMGVFRPYKTGTFGAITWMDRRNPKLRPSDIGAEDTHLHPGYPYSTRPMTTVDMSRALSARCVSPIEGAATFLSNLLAHLTGTRNLLIVFPHQFGADKELPYWAKWAGAEGQKHGGLLPLLTMLERWSAAPRTGVDGKSLKMGRHWAVVDLITLVESGGSVRWGCGGEHGCVNAMLNRGYTKHDPQCAFSIHLWDGLPVIDTKGGCIRLWRHPTHAPIPWYFTQSKF